MFQPARHAFTCDTPAAPVFDAVEAAAVRLGASDPLSSVGGTRSRLSRWLFGAERRLPLANPQLEALRQVTVLLRHARVPSLGQLNAARRAGVSERQLCALWSLFRGEPGSACPA